MMYYLTSVIKQETTYCFLISKYMREFPRRKPYDSEILKFETRSHKMVNDANPKNTMNKWRVKTN